MTEAAFPVGDVKPADMVWKVWMHNDKVRVDGNIRSYATTYSSCYYFRIWPWTTGKDIRRKIDKLKLKMTIEATVCQAFSTKE